MKVGIYGYGFVGQATHVLMKVNPVIVDLKEFNYISQYLYNKQYDDDRKFKT